MPERQANFEGIESVYRQNRLDFLRTELEIGLTFAEIAKTETAIGNTEHASKSRANAELAYKTTLHLISLPEHANHVTEEQREEFMERLQQLRTRLDKA